MTITADTAAELAAADYLLGLGSGRYHAVTPRAIAAGVVEKATGEEEYGPRLIASSVCSRWVMVAKKFGRYRRDAVPASRDMFCPECSWHVALTRGEVAAELEELAPSGRELAAMARLTPDPFIARRLCVAILADYANEWDPRYEPDEPPELALQLLAHVTAHVPVLLIPEDCAESDHGCSHRPETLAWDDRTWRCDYPAASLGCAACSIRAGGYAGEWEGQYTRECTVPAPCQVLQVLAAQMLPRAATSTPASAAPAAG
jgi:hypothetical protein